MCRVDISELKSYTFEHLKKLMKVSELELNEIIKELSLKNIIRVNTSTNEYKFKFVGMICTFNRYIYCYPKYIENIGNTEEMKSILRVIKKYSNNSKKLLKDNVEFEGLVIENSQLSIIHNMMFLIDDYLNYGLYKNEISFIEINGGGEADWNSTIDNTNPILMDRGPVYCDLHTNSIVDDFGYIITQIHKFIISKSSRFLNSIGFCDIFGYPIIDFNISINQIGSLYNMVDYINQELNIQFYDRHIHILKAIKNILLNLNQSMTINSTIIYGSRSFYTIWEKVCSFVLENEYESIKYLIEKPKWTDFKTGKITEKETLEPDIIRNIKENKQFFIVDAKYYKTYFDVNGDIKETCPGIQDITKQYLYNKILEKEINDGYRVYNILLFPTNVELELFGSVSLEFFKELGLNDIYLIKINASEIFNMYVNNQVYSNHIFEIISNEIDNYN